MQVFIVIRRKHLEKPEIDGGGYFKNSENDDSGHPQMAIFGRDYLWALQPPCFTGCAIQEPIGG